MHDAFSLSRDPVHHRSFFKQRSFPRSSTNSHKFYINFLIISICILLTLLQIHTLIKTSTATSSSLTFPSSSSTLTHHVHNLIGQLELSQTMAELQQHSTAVEFLPLKDPRLASTAMEGNTWFMSSINDTKEKGEAEHLYFSSKEMHEGRLLCLASGNTYALAAAGALPKDAKLLPGLTFVSDSYYSYDNLFHGLTAMAPFVAWYERKGCVVPARWVLYQQGEMRKELTSPWVRALMEATFGGAGGMEMEQLMEKSGGELGRPSCFEEAVVFRHNQGSMGKERKEKVYDLLRCKARAYCNITRDHDAKVVIRLTLLLRVGARSFKDDDAVIRIFEKECLKVEGCRLKVARPNNLTVCDQVKLMSETDILASPHGAQLTNMFLMEKNSSVMEFFPKGWQEFAGVGQYVYRWVADWSRMTHHGAWYDPINGEECSSPPHHNNLTAITTSCFSLIYKNRQIGHDEVFFSNWTARVLDETRKYKLYKSMRRTVEHIQEEDASHCKCG